MALATAVMFSNIRDDYRTPEKAFRRLQEAHGFSIDCAASRKNRKLAHYFGPDHEDPACRDALQVNWMVYAQVHGLRPSGFWNCPYSLCAEFVEKAAVERERGFFSDGLIPVRSDTKWWHRFIWHREKQRPRPGIGLDFLPGRLQFFLDVTDEMRAAVRRHEADAIRPKTVDARKDLEKSISARVGLPVLIVRAILDGKPEAVAGAPFPSVAVSFHPESRA